MTIKRLQNAYYVTADMDRAAAFYGDVLGLPTKFRDGMKWAQFDADRRFGRRAAALRECSECRSGDVLTGRIKPTECAQFGVRCTPDSPLGAPMVSAEGACAAYYRYAPMRSTEEANAV